MVAAMALDFITAGEDTKEAVEEGAKEGVVVVETQGDARGGAAEISAAAVVVRGAIGARADAGAVEASVAALKVAVVGATAVVVVVVGAAVSGSKSAS